MSTAAIHPLAHSEPAHPEPVPAVSPASSSVVSSIASSLNPMIPVGRVLRLVTKPVAVAWPKWAVDEWGRDARLVEIVSPLAHLRWDISVGGESALPNGGALIVINTRRMALTPISTALALSNALDRPVRFVGRPDVIPLGPFLRRIGGILADPDEVGGALRNGELVVLGAASTSNPRHAGKVDHELVAAAVRERAPIYVAATLSTMIGRSARVEVSGPLRAGRKRRGPLAEVELAEQAQRRLQEMLDEMGGQQTGLPGLGWIGGG